MAYDGSQLSLLSKLIGLGDGVWLYRSTDTFIGTVDAASYFSDGYSRGMRTGNLVIYHKTDGTQPSLGYVSASSSSTLAATVTALGSGASAGVGSFTTLAVSLAATLSSTLAVTKAATFSSTLAAGATTVTDLTATGNAAIGDAAADTLGFYGATAVSQRASSVQATSNIASSTDFGATQLAVVQEIMTTLKATGLWKGTA